MDSQNFITRHFLKIRESVFKYWSFFITEARRVFINTPPNCSGIFRFNYNSLSERLAEFFIV